MTFLFLGWVFSDVSKANLNALVYLIQLKFLPSRSRYSVRGLLIAGHLGHLTCALAVLLSYFYVYTDYLRGSVRNLMVLANLSLRAL